MRRGKKQVIKESIHRYFTRQNAAGREYQEKNLNTSDTAVATTSKMAAEMSNAQLLDQLRDLIVGSEAKLDKKLNDGFTELKENISLINNKMENIEKEMDSVKSTQTDDRKRIETLETKLNKVTNSLLQSQVHERKYNLLIYGLEGYETTPEATIKKIKDFAVTNLKMDVEYAKRLTIRNAHRLQRRDPPGTTPVIVVFMYWTERDAFLRAGKNLAGSKISIRTDLPPELKEKRGILAREAFEMRRGENVQARVREKGADLWIEKRPKEPQTEEDKVWKRV